jgi:hypothetical protein
MRCIADAPAARRISRTIRWRSHINFIEVELANADDLANVIKNLKQANGKARFGSHAGDVYREPKMSSWERSLNQFAAHETSQPDIRPTIATEERLTRLRFQLHAIEDAIKSVRMFMSASDAIQEILCESLYLLEKSKLTFTPSSRRALADCYEKLKNQIDAIVVDAQLEGHNLAAGDSLSVSLAENESNPFKVDSAGISVDALGLSADSCGLESDMEITQQVSRVELAIEILKTRRTVIETARTIFEIRAKFSRVKIDLLRSVRQNKSAHGEANGTTGGIAAPCLGDDQAGQKERSTVVVPDSPDPTTHNHEQRKDAMMSHGHRDCASLAQPTVQNARWEQALMANDNHHRQQNRERLDELAKDLSCLLRRENYFQRWLKYDAGESEIFTRELAESYGPDLIKLFRDRYIGGGEFKEFTDQYMSEFEAWIEQKIDNVSDRTSEIDTLLKTDLGTVYITTVRASGRMESM